MKRDTAPSRVRPVAVVGDRCGEGVIWCAEEDAIYWTDVNRFLVHRMSWPDCRLAAWLFDEPATALALSSEPGRLLVALASKLIWWWPSEDRREDHGFTLPGHPKVRLNDGGVDPLGRFWVGSMYNDLTPEGAPTDIHFAKDAGVLYRIADDGRASEQAGGIGISNTLCWNPDGTRFYFADTMKNVIRRYAFDRQAGEIADQGIHLGDYAKGVPDGSAIDAEGFLWNCRWGGGGIVRIAPDGAVHSFHPIPTLNMTNCAFGGAGLTTLFVTSAANHEDPGDRLAGSLWAMDAGVKGLPDYRVRVGTGGNG